MTSQLFVNIDHVTTAEGGILALRRLLLSLALNGRFTQASSTEAAGLRSTLLQLDALKKAYVESGKVSRKAVGLSDDAQPSQGLCPEGWVSVIARDVFLSRSGNSKLIKGKLFPEAAPNLFPGFSASGPDVWLESFEHEGSAVIVSAVGARCGKAFLATGRWSAIANTHIIWPIVELVMPEFAMLWLNDEAFWTRSGGAQPFIKVADTLSRTLPLPSLEEQHRIVAKVDELMALCDRLEADQADAEAAHAQLVQALLDSLTQATDAADFRASWQRLSEHFHTLFTTEASIDELKQTVLQLAVMGKLVSQRNTDDNVEELLASIKSKKAALYQDRLIAKPRVYIDLPNIDLPFKVCSTWRWARLGEMGITSTGSTPPTSRPECFGGDTPFIGPGQLDVNGQISFGDKSLSDEGLAVSTVAEPGDVLMVCIGGSIGKSAKVQERLAFNQQINSVSVLLADGGYVNLVMMSPYFQRQVLAASTGSATPIINRTKWEDICVPVPPLAEQHRIVAKVDELMALCDQLKAQLADACQQHAQLATALVEQAVA